MIIPRPRTVSWNECLGWTSLSMSWMLVFSQLTSYSVPLMVSRALCVALEERTGRVTYCKGEHMMSCM